MHAAITHHLFQLFHASHYWGSLWNSESEMNFFHGDFFFFYFTSLIFVFLLRGVNSWSPHETHWSDWHLLSVHMLTSLFYAVSETKRRHSSGQNIKVGSFQPGSWSPTQLPALSVLSTSFIILAMQLFCVTFSNHPIIHPAPYQCFQE